MNFLINSIPWIIFLLSMCVESKIYCNNSTNDRNIINCSDFGSGEILSSACKQLYDNVQINLTKTSILDKLDFEYCNPHDLRIVNGALEDIQAGAFEDFTKLYLLNISGNALSRIRYSSLPKANQSDNFETPVLILDASHNKIQEVIGDVSNLPLIQDLDLNYNKISDLSRIALPNPEKIYYLRLSHNEIQSIPLNSVSKLKSLYSLDLSSNKLHDLSFGVFNNLIHLSILDLSDNLLISSDLHTISGLRNLNYLFFHRNQIDKLDFEDFPGTIREVSFYGNKLKFSCQELVQIVQKYGQKIFIRYGPDLDKENVHGMTCDNLKSNPNKSVNQNEESKLFDQEFLEIGLKNFTNKILEDYKNFSSSLNFLKDTKFVQNQLQVTLNPFQFGSVLIILIIILILLLFDRIQKYLVKVCFRKNVFLDQQNFQSNGFGLDGLENRELLQV